MNSEMNEWKQLNTLAVYILNVKIFSFRSEQYDI